MTVGDQDALDAALDLVGRTGARSFELGYLHDGPVEQAAWYAHVQYRGARISVENRHGPVEAAEALARRLLTGGKCTGCGRLVALSDTGAVAYRSAVMADGTRFTAEDAAAAGQCRWRRVGARWEMGCTAGEQP